MIKPQGLNFFTAAISNVGPALGAIETPPLFRFARPATFVLWVMVLSLEFRAVLSSPTPTDVLLVTLSTGLFASVQFQFWYEESDQGQRFRRAIERSRGRIYEDELTGLPNSRHFVFELRRQMMRAAKGGRTFWLVLTDIATDGAKSVEDDTIRPVARALRLVLGESDFLARLQGTIFASIVVEEHDQAVSATARELLRTAAAALQDSAPEALSPIVSCTRYDGELELIEFLRRAQRDLISARSVQPPTLDSNAAGAAAA